MADSTTKRAVPDEGAASPRLQDLLTAHFNISGGWHTWSCECGADAQDVQYRDITHPEHQVAAVREARTIRTVDQLDALPAETVIKTEGGSIACRHYSGVGVVFGDDRPFPWTTSLVSELPALLLWHPEWSVS